ncbi:hypothetical protein ACHAW6_002140 [Cyclotella cf. meneghiniana]
MMQRLLTIVSCLVHFQFASGQHSIERPISIMNQSGRRVEVHWVPPYQGEMVLQSKPDILNGASLNLNSYVGHTFQVRELPGKVSGVCAGENQQCRIEHFTVNSNDNQVVFLRPDMEIEHSDTKTIAEKSASKLLESCRADAKSHLLHSPHDAASILERLSSCVQSGVAVEIEKANEEIQFQSDIRMDMAELLEEYTCADETLNTTEAKATTSWRGKTVRVLLDRPAAKIHYVEEFVTEDECAAVHEDVEGRLKDATVADGAGGSELDESRKAKQAGIEVDWDEEENGDLIARLSRRVYDYTNHVLPMLDIDEEGQENLMSIQYFGRGRDDDAPDRYMAHCDGDCDGFKFKNGERMATMVMYCDIPKVSDTKTDGIFELLSLFVCGDAGEMHTSDRASTFANSHPHRSAVPPTL